MHFTANLSPLGFLKKSFFFFEKPIYFFKKDPNFERFEKSYYFSRILRQICYNLVKKCLHVQKREQTCRCRVNAIGNHRVKKTSEMVHLRGRFCFHILKNMAQNKNAQGELSDDYIAQRFSKLVPKIMLTSQIINRLRPMQT